MCQPTRHFTWCGMRVAIPTTPSPIPIKSHKHPDPIQTFARIQFPQSNHTIQSIAIKSGPSPTSIFNPKQINPDLVKPQHTSISESRTRTRTTETHSNLTMFATQSPSTPFRQTGHYTPVRPSPLGQRSTNIPTPPCPWTMESPTRAGPGSIQIQPKPTGTEENSNSNFNAFSPVAFSLNNRTPTFSHNHNDNVNNNNERPVQQRQHHSSPIFATTAAPTTPFFFSPHPYQVAKSPSPSPSTRNSKFADRYASQVSNPMKSSNGLTRSKTRKMFLNKVRSERDEGRFEARGEQMMHADYLADKRRWEESMARDMVVQDPEDVDEMIPGRFYFFFLSSMLEAMY